jgi:hypothetical protein
MTDRSSVMGPAEGGAALQPHPPCWDSKANSVFSNYLLFLILKQLKTDITQKYGLTTSTI